MKKTQPYQQQLTEWRKRREHMKELHAAGFSLSQIGAKMGCTKQRVHQLLRQQAAA
jgi:predicted DNA-binding protein YlxM (UPF0122 family)